MIDDESFNVLTNNFVSFQQAGPGPVVTYQNETSKLLCILFLGIFA